MTDSEPTTPTPQMGRPEMLAIGARFRARADSVLMRDQPQQAGDLRTAARLIEHLAHVLAEIRRAADATEDESTELHLRELLGGQ
jgi:hypothetical protein